MVTTLETHRTYMIAKFELLVTTNTNLCTKFVRDGISFIISQEISVNVDKQCTNQGNPLGTLVLGDAFTPVIITTRYCLVLLRKISDEQAFSSEFLFHQIICYKKH
jgi:hypothetical protein